MSEQSPIRIQFRDFGSEQEIPMAFPSQVTREEVLEVAKTLINEGKARTVRVVDTSTGAELWRAEWQLVTGQLGA